MAVKKKKATPASRRIDVHSHVIPGEIMQAIERDPARFQMRFEEREGKRRIVREGGNVFPVFPEFSDPAVKVAGMDRKGLDVSFISPAPMVLFYWLDAGVALEASRLVNDGIANMVSAYPERLKGMGTLPMQNPDAAIAELERIVRDHGFRAIELGTSVENEQLSDARFRPVLRRAQELKVFIFAHPYSFTPECGTENYHLRNLIGNPLHTTIMVANLMFSGALDDLKQLRIVLAHGGGYVPYQIGRFVHGHKVRKDTKADTRTSPERMLRRFWYDALVHDERALRYLIERVGADRVVLATDAPFDMGEEKPLERLAQLKRMSASDRALICAGNAMKLYGRRL
ncbi:MAG: amidohydrolase [Proteobacteria bacterium]|nr:amidohydrolase [Burkholderiales bacterium]